LEGSRAARNFTWYSTTTVFRRKAADKWPAFRLIGCLTAVPQWTSPRARGSTEKGFLLLFCKKEGFALAF
jgi:hypothetical protein